MKNYASISSLFVCLLLASACHPVPGPDKTIAGGILGAGWGAGAGAVIGNQTNNTGPGAAVGAGFGAASGMLTGMGLDLAEGQELESQRQLDALKVQVAANSRRLLRIQDALDYRDRKLARTSTGAQVFFDANRASLRGGSAQRLQRIASAIKLNPYVGRVELHGHSDDTGVTDRNLRMSEARARSVATFLANQGISMDQLQVYAHGAERPLASNETEPGRQLNRRVEVVLLKIDFLK